LPGLPRLALPTPDRDEHPNYAVVIVESEARQLRGQLSGIGARFMNPTVTIATKTPGG
jgi:hypothetical protein